MELAAEIVPHSMHGYHANAHDDVYPAVRVRGVNLQDFAFANLYRVRIDEWQLDGSYTSDVESSSEYKSDELEDAASFDIDDNIRCNCEFLNKNFLQASTEDGPPPLERFCKECKV